MQFSNPLHRRPASTRASGVEQLWLTQSSARSSIGAVRQTLRGAMSRPTTSLPITCARGLALRQRGLNRTEMTVLRPRYASRDSTRLRKSAHFSREWRCDDHSRYPQAPEHLVVQAGGEQTVWKTVRQARCTFQLLAMRRCCAGHPADTSSTKKITTTRSATARYSKSADRWRIHLSDRSHVDGGCAFLGCDQWDKAAIDALSGQRARQIRRRDDGRSSWRALFGEGPWSAERRGSSRSRAPYRRRRTETVQASPSWRGYFDGEARRTSS